MSRSAVEQALYALQKDERILDHGAGRDHVYHLEGSNAGPTHGLHPPALRVLRLIMEEDGLTGSQLAKKAGLSRSEISRLTGQLVDIGAVVAVQSGRDMVYIPG